MKTSTVKKTSSRMKVYALSFALALIATASASSPAFADRDWDHHAAYAHRNWHHWHGARPGYVNAPPVVYAPPPEEQSTGINLILPIHFN